MKLSSLIGITAAFGAHVLNFSGYKWEIKGSAEPVGPGPNIFVEKNVSVDEQGWLHLKISNNLVLKSWTSSEIWPTVPLGYGTYEIIALVENRELWDENMVFGAFTWDYKPDKTQGNSDREIDFEISKWGSTELGAPDLQYVIQPLDETNGERSHSENHHRFRNDWAHQKEILYRMVWTPTNITFSTLAFGVGHSEHSVDYYEYRGDLNPTPGDARFHLNFWLYQGKLANAPKASGFEVIVKKFTYISIK